MLMDAKEEELMDTRMEDLDEQVQREEKEVKSHLEKVQQLAQAVKQQFAARRQQAQAEEEEEDESMGSDEEDLDDSLLFDWRAKGI